MKIETWMLDEARQKVYNYCWWNQSNVAGFTEKNPQPDIHSNECVHYLAYSETAYADYFKYWIVTLCTTCSKVYKRKERNVRLINLSLKDLLYLKLIGKHYETTEDND